MSIKIQGTAVIDDSRNLVNILAGTFSGNITLSSGTVTGLRDPTAATEAATKNYVDTNKGTATPFYAFDQAI